MRGGCILSICRVQNPKNPNLIIFLDPQLFTNQWSRLES